MLRFNRKSYLLLFTSGFILFTLIIYILIYHQNAGETFNAVLLKQNRNRVEEHLLKWHVADDNNGKRDSHNYQAAINSYSKFDKNDINAIGSTEQESKMSATELKAAETVETAAETVETAAAASAAAFTAKRFSSQRDQQRLRSQQRPQQHQHNFFHNKQQRQNAAKHKRLKIFHQLKLAKSSASSIANSSMIELKKEATNQENNLQLTGFNVKLSENLPLKRFIPDTRHESCKSQQYSAGLPPVSVIIIYYNEHPSVLLRSLFSIVERTPRELLKEIILIDDYSDAQTNQLSFDKDIALKFQNTVKIYHLPQREGLIRARLKGAQKAKAEVIMFLDAHIEVNENWLPPLLQPIMENPNSTTTPIIDIIRYDTLEYQGSVATRGGFNWQFNYVQLPLLEHEDPSRPHNNPIMNGGLFAIRQDYFWLLGGYDEGLEIWGAEQFELSFKIWMCAGRLLEVPCSRVGHLYRSPEYAVKYSQRKDDFISKNYKRVAEVWMDEYREFLYEHVPKLNQIEPGDLSKQKALRNSLKCKSFKWFLTNIAPDLLKIYPPIKPPDYASGAIQSLAASHLCLDMSTAKARQILPAGLLRACSPDLRFPYASQKFHLGFLRDLQYHDYCLESQKWSAYADIWLWPCHKHEGNQYWYYNRSSQMIIQGKQEFMQRCLDFDEESGKLFLNYCDFSRLQQKWNFGYVNETAMEKFFEK